MGIGPADAIRGALQKAGLSLADMDLVEVRFVVCVVGMLIRVLESDYDRAREGDMRAYQHHPEDVQDVRARHTRDCCVEYECICRVKRELRARNSGLLS